MDPSQSSQLGATQLRDPATPQDLAYVQQMMLNMDPPQHTRLRRLLINAFTSKAVTQLEQKIAGHAEAIVDRIIGDASEGECDFVTDIAADMPLLCLADIFGLPQEDRYLMYDWANRVIGYQDPDYASSSAFDQRGGSELARQALERRPLPDANGRMPDPRSRNGIPGGMIALLEHPAAWTALQENPALLPGAIEEMLRWWTPVMNFRRTATADTELGGEKIAAGDKVVVSFLSANYDARQFDYPMEFDIHRAPNAHLSFGYGPHFCLGAQLAITQMRAIFGELTRRFASIVVTDTPRYLRSNFQRGVKSLPIRWRIRK